MTPHRVNYDQIAPEYDRRYAHIPLQDRGKALLALARRLQAQRVLEAGCGTGHWLMALRTLIPHLFGLDFSKGMLTQAQKHNAGLHLTRGTAIQLPFRSEPFDLIYCVDAIHHLGDPRAFIAEALRLLRPGGALAIFGSDPRHDIWYAYDYFETVYATDLARFPSREELIEWMQAEGFSQVDLQIVEEIKEVFAGRQIFDHPFLKKNSCSQLALLSDTTYQSGIAKIKAAVHDSEARGETISFRNELFIHMLVGYKPVT